MHNEAPFSFTLKVNGDLFSIRGEDVFDFIPRLEAAATVIPAIIALQEAAKGSQSVSEARAVQNLQNAGFAPQIVSAPAETAPVQQVREAPTGGLEERTDKWGNKYIAGVPDTGFCQHGARVKATKSRRDGGTYTAYVCVNDSPFGDYRAGKCDMVSAKR